jgi:hypothetical protein
MPIAPAAPPEAPEAPLPGWRYPFALVLAGMALLGFAGLFEYRWVENEPGGETLLLLDAADAPEGGVKVWRWPLPEETLPVNREALMDAVSAEDAEVLVAALEQGMREYLVVAALDGAAVDSLVAEGRAPRPGAPELLAGDLTRHKRLRIGGKNYEVVGRLSRAAGPFAGSYLMAVPPGSAAPDLGLEDAPREGWLYLSLSDDLRAYLRDMLDGLRDRAALEGEVGAEEGAKDIDQSPMPEVVEGLGRTRPAIAWTAWFGLLYMAAGGALVYRALYVRLALRRLPVLGALLDELATRQRLWIGLHVALYGVFFAAMALGLALPAVNRMLVQGVAAVFSEGSLEYISSAYMSGDIVHAAYATFYNNFLVQTVGLTFFPTLTMWAGGGGLPLALAVALVWVPFGVLKTGFSFALAGFVMAPSWIGVAERYTFHGITMILELEAYILACIAVVLWPSYLLRAIAMRHWLADGGMAVKILLAGILMSGAGLAITALYEAASLILLSA